MGDCPGAGSGDWHDYEQRLQHEIERDEYHAFGRWTSKKGFKIDRWDYPKKGELFCPNDSPMYDERKILIAETKQLFGTNEEIPMNFEERKYYILKKK